MPDTSASLPIPPDRPDSSAAETVQDISLGRRFFQPRTLIWFAIGAAILAFAITRFQIDARGTFAAIMRANPLLLLLAFAACYAAFPFRALRWRRMLLNAGFPSEEIPGIPRLVLIVYLSWFANCVVPAKLGDVYRAYLLKTSGGHSISKAGGTIVAERLVDLAAVLVLLSIAGLVSLRGALPQEVTYALELGGALLAAAGVALVAMRRWSGTVWRLLPSRVGHLYGRFQEGAFGAFGAYPELAGFTVVIWAGEIARLFLVTRAVGLQLSANPLAELAMLSFVALASALLTAPPGTPGGLGYVEATIVWAILKFGSMQGMDIPDNLALSVALLDRSISYGSFVVLGLIVYLLGGLTWRRGLSRQPVASAEATRGT